MRTPIETIEQDGLRADIFQEEYLDSPRTEFDHLGKMVCWSRRHDLGDEQPKWEPEDFFYQIVSDWYFYERKPRVNIPHPDDVTDSALRGYREKLKEIANNKFIILPLYLYDHSGITMRTSKFSCQWDSGQVGYIYVSLDKVRENWPSAKGEAELIEKGTACLEAEVKEYDQFITGDVYYVNVTREDKCDHGTDHREDVDSCGGLYGLDYAKAEAQRMLNENSKKVINA